MCSELNDNCAKFVSTSMVNIKINYYEQNISVDWLAQCKRTERYDRMK